LLVVVFGIAFFIGVCLQQTCFQRRFHIYKDINIKEKLNSVKRALKDIL
jgi:hypothetical protein